MSSKEKSPAGSQASGSKSSEIMAAPDQNQWHTDATPNRAPGAAQPAHFGDVRSAVQAALDREAERDAFRTAIAWARACAQLQRCADNEQRRARPYLAAHLAEAVGRAPLARLDGSDRQRSWAKSRRLRALQLAGVAGWRASDEPVELLTLLLMRCVADAGAWIAWRDAIEGGRAR